MALGARLPASRHRRWANVLDECSEVLCQVASEWVGLPADWSILTASARALRATIGGGSSGGARALARTSARRTAERSLGGHRPRGHLRRACGGVPAGVAAFLEAADERRLCGVADEVRRSVRSSRP